MANDLERVRHFLRDLNDEQRAALEDAGETSPHWAAIELANAGVEIGYREEGVHKVALTPKSVKACVAESDPIQS